MGREGCEQASTRSSYLGARAKSSPVLATQGTLEDSLCSGYPVAQSILRCIVSFAQRRTSEPSFATRVGLPPSRPHSRGGIRHHGSPRAGKARAESARGPARVVVIRSYIRASSSSLIGAWPASWLRSVVSSGSLMQVVQPHVRARKPPAARPSGSHPRAGGGPCKQSACTGPSAPSPLRFRDTR